MDISMFIVYIAILAVPFAFGYAVCWLRMQSKLSDSFFDQEEILKENRAYAKENKALLSERAALQRALCEELGKEVSETYSSSGRS